MKKLTPLVSVLGIAFAALLSASAANAQATRTWVSGVGDDANPCSRTAPCKTFAGAISKTAAGGEINCIDPGGFGAVTITKSITIDCGGTFGSILAAGTNAINVNAAGIIVRIRNVSINGAGTGLIGINFINGSALFVENVRIMNFNAGTAVGIRFAPTTPAHLMVSDSFIENNGILPTTGGGISILPAAGGQVAAEINRSTMAFNVTGVGVLSTSGPIFAVLRDSVVVSSRSNGVLSIAGLSLTFTIDRSSIVNNTGFGVQSSGASSLVRIGGTTITTNTTGVGVVSGGIMQSFKNNQIAGNTTDGTPITAFPGPGGTPLQ